MSVVRVYIPSPYNVLLYFLEGHVHKDSKLGVMTKQLKPFTPAPPRITAIVQPPPF